MTGKRLKTRAISIAVVGLTAWTCLDVQAEMSFRTVAMKGNAAPGTEPGVVYSSFNALVLNEVGQAAFWGSLTGTGVNSTSDTGIWSEGGGSLDLVVREGAAAPGTPAGVVYSDITNGFDRFSVPVLNGLGQTVFRGNLTGAGVTSLNKTGIWSESSGSLSLIARTGDPVPDTGAGVMYIGLSNPVLNGAGQTAFIGALTGAGVDITNNRGIWSGGTDSLSLLARTGNAAPGTDPGVVYSFFSSPPVLNEAGQTAFWGALAGPGVDGTNVFGIWSEGSGSLGLVARGGDAAPSTLPGVVYTTLNDPVINAAGQTAFFADLTGPGVDSTNDTGIWSEGSGSLDLVAREGDPAPDTQPGIVFSQFDVFTTPVINMAGQTAFFSLLTGPGVGSNSSGLWSEGGGSLHLVARSGDPAPGTGQDIVFGPFGHNNPILNSAGQIAFRSVLTGPGVDNTNDRGIWATDPNGVLKLIARQGDLFDVNDDPLIDDLRTISFINELVTGSGGGDGRPVPFNDAGQLGIWLSFTDGTSGVFVATIPEPGSFAVFIIGSALALRRRRC